MSLLPLRASGLQRPRARARVWPWEGEVRSDGSGPTPTRDFPARWVLMLMFLYTVPAILTMRPIIDLDIWWHLRTGQWIVEHGAVPRTDPFSSHGMGKPWVAYSWLFEVLIYALYRLFGLFGIVLYRVIFSLLVVVALHALVRRFEPRVPRAVALTALGLLAMSPLLGPRSFLFSILFFIVEIHVLLAARESGQARQLLLLPPLFALWANVHIEFVYGLLALGLAAAEPLLGRLRREREVPGDTRSLPFRGLLFVWLACLLATLATPYHVWLYGVLIDIAGQTGQFQYITELASLQFRQPADWVILGLTLGAAFSLGRRARVQPFPLLLLVAGALLSFRANRDAWFVVVSSLAIIVTSRPAGIDTRAPALTRGRISLVAAAVIVVLFGIGLARRLSERGLEAAMAERFPVAAAAFVEEQDYPGPLYNHFDWGGYLIWRLPTLPVSIDGRSNLHGDDRIWRSIKTWVGQRSWVADPELSSARLVIGSVDSALASLLRLDPRFELVYEDRVAAVFVTRDHGGGS